MTSHAEEQSSQKKARVVEKTSSEEELSEGSGDLAEPKSRSEKEIDKVLLYILKYGESV